MESEAKVLLLLECYLMQRPLMIFSLIADTNYIMQNVIRLMRGMFEIALRKNLYRTAMLCLEWTIRLDKRLLMGHSFARQFARSANVNPLTYQRMEQNMGFLKEDILTIMESNPDNFTLENIFEDDKQFIIQKFGTRTYVRK